MLIAFWVGLVMIVVGTCMEQVGFWLQRRERRAQSLRLARLAEARRIADQMREDAALAKPQNAPGPVELSGEQGS